jgi:protein gp37
MARSVNASTAGQLANKTTSEICASCGHPRRCPFCGASLKGKTKIQWTGRTWNVVVGCSKCSKGCQNCYAIPQSFLNEVRHIPQYQGLTILQNGRYNWTGEVRLVEHKLEEPLHWRKPQMVFVNSMSDLFHEHLPDAAIIRVAEVMHRANWHVFQVLTKRSERMRDLLNSKLQFCAQDSHIWWGVSVENRQSGLPRIEHLRSADVAVRFLSIEPLLEYLGALDLSGIHWAIVGGESRHGARTFDLQWGREIVSQYLAQQVPCFMKQVGSRPVCDGNPVVLTDFKGGDPQDWPEDLRVREFPKRTDSEIQRNQSPDELKPEHPTLTRPESVRSLQDPAFAAKRHEAALKAWATRRVKARADAENKNVEMKEGEK